MPFSETARRPWVLTQLRYYCDLDSITSVVDVGAGAGTWLTFLGPSLPNASWTAVEIWEPYVGSFGLQRRYEQVIVSDVRELDPLPEADLYLFGDVLEHMPEADALKVWERARRACKWLVLALPVKPHPQGALEGNPFEEHVAHWTMTTVLDSFDGIVAYQGPPPVPPGSTAGAFIAQGRL